MTSDFQNVSRVLQYFEDRFACFYVEEPLSNYNELFDRLKKAISVLQGVNVSKERLFVLAWK